MLINVRKYRRGKSRETGNIGYTIRRKTQRNWQHRVHNMKKNTAQYVLDTTVANTHK
jgi:hypothetical protein